MYKMQGTIKFVSAQTAAKCQGIPIGQYNKLLQSLSTQNNVINCDLSCLKFPKMSHARFATSFYSYTHDRTGVFEQQHPIARFHQAGKNLLISKSCVKQASVVTKVLNAFKSKPNLRQISAASITMNKVVEAKQADYGRKIKLD